MKKYAVIDIGTNSMRLLLATIENNKIIEGKKYINTSRIGSAVDKNKIISQDGISRNIEAFYEFTQKAKQYGAEEIKAIATSAVRDAKNKEQFIEAIHQKTGININTISGEEEAILGYRGVIMGMDRIEGIEAGDDKTKILSPYPDPGQNIIVIDIGGGSTEIILGEGSKLKNVKSLNIGAVRMTERFITSDPINIKEYRQMEAYICKTIKEAKQEITSLITDKKGNITGTTKTQTIESTPQALSTIGIGGTITTLAALHQELDIYNSDKIHNYKLTLDNINNLKGQLLSLTVEEIKQLKGIHPKRADIIVAGITILSAIMQAFNLEEITVSEYDNLEGLLYTEI